jgi:hypothetical protein
LQIACLEWTLAYIIKEVACFSSSEPVVGQELNVRNSRFSCLTVTFDETEDGASRNKDKSVDENSGVNPIYFRGELSVNICFNRFPFILLGNSKAAHHGVGSEVPSLVSEDLFLEQFTDLLNVISS